MSWTIVRILSLFSVHFPLFSFCQYVVNCNNIGQMPDVTFQIHGQEFTLPASAYVRQVSVFFFRLTISSLYLTTVWNCFPVPSPPHTVSVLWLPHWLRQRRRQPVDPGRCLHQTVLFHLQQSPEHGGSGQGYMIDLKWPHPEVLRQSNKKSYSSRLSNGVVSVLMCNVMTETLSFPPIDISLNSINKS